MPTDTLGVDMIVKAISEGFDKVAQDITGVGGAYEKSAKAIADANKRIEQAAKSSSDAVAKGAQAQEMAYAKASEKMAFQAQMISQKYEEQKRQQEELRKSALALGAGFTAVAVAGGALLGSSIKLAARVQTLGVVTARLGENVGYTEPRIRALEKAVMDQGITMQAARVSIARMIQANIDLSKAAELARLAQDAAVIAGINSSDAFEQLSTAIATGQVRMLRSLGITVTFEQAYKDMAETLGKGVDELTELEKTQARTNIVLEQGKQITGAYESAMDTAGKKVASLDRHIEESKRMLGEVWLPVYADVIDALTESLKAWEGLDQGTKDTASSLIGVVTVTASVMAGLTGLIGVGQKAVGVFKGLNVTLRGTEVALGGATAGLTIFIALLAEVAVLALQGRKEMDDFIQTLRDLEPAGDNAASSYQEYLQGVQAVAKEMGFSTKIIDNQIYRIDELGNVLTDGTRNFRELFDVMTAESFAAAEAQARLAVDLEMVDSKMGGVNASAEELTQEQKDLNKALLEGDDAMQGFGDRAEFNARRLAKMREEEALARIETVALAAGLRGVLQSAMEDNERTMGDLIEQHSELIAQKQELLDSGYNPEGEKIQEINEALEENVQKQKEAGEAIAETTAEMIYQQAAAGLDAQASLELARSMGILSEADYAVATAIQSLREEFDANADGLISAKEGAEEYAETVALINQVVDSLIASGLPVTLDNIATALSVASQEGDGIAEALPEVAGGFDEAGGAAEDGTEKAGDFFDTISEKKADAIEGTGEVQSAVESAGGAFDEAKTPVSELGKTISDVTSQGVSDVQGLQKEIDALHGKEIIIRIRTVGNIPEGMQHGGEMEAGMMALVGEGGPELFVAPTKGTIIPNYQSSTFLARANAGGGGGVQMPFQVARPISNETYQDIFVEGDTFVLEGGDLATVQAVAATFKKDRLTKFVGR